MPAPAGPDARGLTAAELAEAFETDIGKIENMLRRGEFRLSSRGADVPWYERDGVFYFYGQGADNRYSTTRTYWLYMKQVGPVMPVVAVEAAVPQAGLTYYATSDIEQDLLWWLSLSTDPADDYWFWTILSPFATTLPVSVPVPASQAADGELTLRLWGASNAAHRLTVRTASGVELGDVEFTGNVEYTTPVPLTIPAAVLGADVLDPARWIGSAVPPAEVVADGPESPRPVPPDRRNRGHRRTRFDSLRPTPRPRLLPGGSPRRW